MPLTLGMDFMVAKGRDNTARPAVRSKGRSQKRPAAMR